MQVENIQGSRLLLPIHFDWFDRLIQLAEYCLEPVMPEGKRTWDKNILTDSTFHLPQKTARGYYLRPRLSSHRAGIADLQKASIQGLIQSTKVIDFRHRRNRQSEGTGSLISLRSSPSALIHLRLRKLKINKEAPESNRI